MRYYSENTVRDIIEGVAHTALAQSKIKNYADAILQNKPNIKISEPHGDLIDRDNLAKHTKINICKTGDDYDDMWKAIYDAPTILEASPSTDGFCNTEGCSNSKPDMSKAQNHICPYYKGVCSLDEKIICYCQHHYEMCDKFIEG